MIIFIAAAFLFVSPFELIHSSHAQQSINEFSDIIVFHRKLTPNKRNRIVDLIQSFGGTVKYRYHIVDAIAVRGLPSRVVDVLSREPDILELKPDEEVQAHLVQSIPIIGADKVHQTGEVGNGVYVCVLDTGIDNNHPAFGNRVILQKDFVNDDNNAQDDNDHGSHVAGIIGSGNSTYTGVTPEVLFLIGKVLDQNGSGTSSDVMAGIEWCVDEGAQVINMSLGGGSFSGSCDNEALGITSNNAVNAGVAVVASSGNSGTQNAMGVPACASETIAVGATYDYNGGNQTWCLRPGLFFCRSSCTDTVAIDDHVCFSNGGTLLDVVAPGSVITSVDAGSGFKNLSGTSMSAPHVSGLAALLLGKDPTLLPNDIREIIRSSAVDLGPVGFDNSYGFGRIDAMEALAAAGGASCSSDDECDDGNICTDDLCDGSGSCQNNALANGTSCSDGNLCNGAETCQAGSCSAGAPINCSDGSACTADSCDPSTGICQNVSISCDDGNACTADSCDSSSGCQNIPKDCNDGNACTTDSCTPSTGNCQNIAINCDDGIACTVDSCDPAIGCINNDDQCSNAVCGDGVCAGVSEGENCNTCPSDCGRTFFTCCGDGRCGFFESFGCPVDC